MTALNFSASEVVSLAVRLCCIGRAVCLFELAVTRQEMLPGGMLNWSVAGLISDSKCTRFADWVRNRIVGVPYRAFSALLLLNVVVILSLFLWPMSTILRVAAAGLLLLEMKRHYFSVDGADEMMLICLLATCFGNIGNSNRAVAYFLAAELSLAYTTAGAYKAASPHWQSGKALRAITRTRAFGHPRVSQMLQRYPWFATASQFALVLWESSFIIALVAPRPLLWFVLFSGIVFHLSCAWVMGLNTFFWAFVASYPAVIYVNGVLHSVIRSPMDGYLAAALGMMITAAIVFTGWWVSRKAAAQDTTSAQVKAAVAAPMPEPAARLLPS